MSTEDNEMSNWAKPSDEDIELTRGSTAIDENKEAEKDKAAADGFNSMVNLFKQSLRK